MTTPEPRRIRVLNFAGWAIIMAGVVGFVGVMFVGAILDPDLSVLTLIRVFILEACCFGVIVVGKTMIDQVSEWHMDNLNRARDEWAKATFKR